jgi:twinkle protein
MADFVQHEPCPKCESRDNLARYSDGSAYCFGCKYVEKAGSDPKEPAAREKGSADLIDGEIVALSKRGLTEESCRFWNYRIGKLASGEGVQIANYLRDGKIIAQKVRTKDKKFRVIGEGKSLPLYGQWLWRGGGKRLIVTEGEIDAITISQLQSHKWPVVSVPNGAQGAAKTFAREIEFLESFDEVVLAFDMDDPGQEAAQECAALLSPGKVRIAHLPAKDANACLTDGLGAELIRSLWEAKPYRPDGVVDVETVAEEAAKPIEFGVPWPWEALTHSTYGIRMREVYGFGAGTGVGKSDVFKEIALHLVKLGHKVGIVALEENPAHTLKVIAGKSINKRLHVPNCDVPKAEVDAAIRSLSGKVFFYNHFGAADYDTIKNKMKFMVQSLGCRFIFLDHLTALAASIDDDERKAIDKIMADLSSLAQQLDCAIFYVSHLTTPEGKPHEEGGRVLEKHFRGSRAIAYWSHFLFGLERDKQNPDGVTTFRVLKDRYTGDSAGLTFGLRYDRATGRVHECELPSEEDDDRPAPFPRQEDY